MTQREHEAELLIGVGSHGVAALGLVRNLTRALRAKGVFSDVEIAAICDATAEEARGNSDPTSERFAESVRQAIRQLESSVLGPSAEQRKH
jgi:hypothetical protein